MCARLMYVMMLCMMLVSCREGLGEVGFSEFTVNVRTHALNLNNRYLTLL